MNHGSKWDFTGLRVVFFSHLWVVLRGILRVEIPLPSRFDDLFPTAKSGPEGDFPGPGRVFGARGVIDLDARGLRPEGRS